MCAEPEPARTFVLRYVLHVRPKVSAVASQLDQMLAFLRSCTDQDLYAIAEGVHLEQRSRALEAGDPAALIAEGFEQGFTSAGMCKDPYLSNGLLVCFGWKLDKSSMKHDCGFVKVNDEWVWESGEKVEHDIRRTIKNGKEMMQSVTVLTAPDGTEVDLLISTTQMAVHQQKEARSWVVKNGQLEHVSTRRRDTTHGGRGM